MKMRELLNLIERVETVDTGRIDGKMTRLYENPSRAEFIGLMRSVTRTRFLIVVADKTFYIWPAMDATHHQMDKYLGHPPCMIGETERTDAGIVVEVDHEDEVRANPHFQRLFGTMNVTFTQMSD